MGWLVSALFWSGCVAAALAIFALGHARRWW